MGCRVEGVGCRVEGVGCRVVYGFVPQSQRVDAVGRLEAKGTLFIARINNGMFAAGSG